MFKPGKSLLDSQTITRTEVSAPRGHLLLLYNLLLDGSVPALDV